MRVEPALSGVEGNLLFPDNTCHPERSERPMNFARVGRTLLSAAFDFATLTTCHPDRSPTTLTTCHSEPSGAAPAARMRVETRFPLTTLVILSDAKDLCTLR